MSKPFKPYFNHNSLVEQSDRIVICSDGVTQSVIGNKEHPLGCGKKNLSHFISKYVATNKECSSLELSLAVLRNAYNNDNNRSKDDISCAVFSFRKSRRLMICSSSPYSDKTYKTLAQKIINYDGRSILCGYTVAEKNS